MAKSANIIPNDTTVTIEGRDEIGTIVGYSKGWYQVNIDGSIHKCRAKQLTIVVVQQDDDQDDDDQVIATTMASQLKAARARYVKSVSASGKSSMHNGDELAQLLSSISPEDVMELAARVTAECGDELIHPSVKYAHLNPGQKRMNSGNLIRSRVKKAMISIDSVATLYSAMIQEEADKVA